MLNKHWIKLQFYNIKFEFETSGLHHHQPPMRGNSVLLSNRKQSNRKKFPSKLICWCCGFSGLSPHPAALCSDWFLVRLSQHGGAHPVWTCGALQPPQPDPGRAEAGRDELPLSDWWEFSCSCLGFWWFYSFAPVASLKLQLWGNYYVSFLDAQETHNYLIGHIITAKHVKMVWHHVSVCLSIYKNVIYS